MHSSAWALLLHNIICSYDRHKKYKRTNAAVFGLFGCLWGDMEGSAQRMSHVESAILQEVSVLAADTSARICSAC